MAVETAPEQTGEETAEGRRLSKYARTRASLKEMFEIGAMPEREYKRNLRSIQRAENKELARAAARQAARRVPFTAAELQDAVHDLANDVTLTQWKKTVAPVVYEMSRTYRRTHHSIQSYTEAMLERALAGPEVETRPRPGPRRRRASATPDVLEARRANIAKAREVVRRNRERAAAAKTGG